MVARGRICDHSAKRTLGLSLIQPTLKTEAAKRNYVTPWHPIHRGTPVRHAPTRRLLPGEQPGQQQRQVERPPEGGQETGNNAGPQDEGLPGPADVPAHGTMTAVRADRPAVPPENEPQDRPEGNTAERSQGSQRNAEPTVRTDRPVVPQGQPEDHTDEHNQGPQRDAGPEREQSRGKGKRWPDGHHHPIASGAVSARRPPGRAGSPVQPQHLRLAPD